MFSVFDESWNIWHFWRNIWYAFSFVAIDLLKSFCHIFIPYLPMFIALIIIIILIWNKFIIILLWSIMRAAYYNAVNFHGDYQIGWCIHKQLAPTIFFEFFCNDWTYKWHCFFILNHYLFIISKLCMRYLYLHINYNDLSYL